MLNDGVHLAVEVNNCSRIHKLCEIEKGTKMEPL